MKHLLLLFCLLLALKTSYAQDTLYYDENLDLTEQNKRWDTKIIVTRNTPDTNIIRKQAYKNTGKITWEYNWHHENNGVVEQYFKGWHPNGQLAEIYYMENKKIVGTKVLYWENGAKKREDKYENEKVQSGKCWNEQGKEIEYFPLSTQAFFPKQYGNINEFVKKSITYPALAKSEKIEGRVILRFVVEKNGRISNIKIEQSVHPILDAEAIRVIKAMPDWEPATYDKKPIKAYFRYPINFELTK